MSYVLYRAHSVRVWLLHELGLQGYLYLYLISATRPAGLRRLRCQIVQLRRPCPTSAGSLGSIMHAHAFYVYTTVRSASSPT